MLDKLLIIFYLKGQRNAMDAWFRSLTLVTHLLLFFFYTNMKQLNWIESNMKPNSLMN
jgi:hypothetical protein